MQTKVIIIITRDFALLESFTNIPSARTFRQVENTRFSKYI